MTSSNSTEVIIVGAGPAGIACAIQLRRYNIPFQIFERNNAGGLLLNANLIENYPGVPEGISGQELVRLMLTQLNSLSITINLARVDSISPTDRRFTVHTNLDSTTSNYVVLATGTRAIIPPEFSSHEKFSDRIHTEVYPLLMERKRNIAVVGAGDAAFDYALNLADNNEITIFNRTNSTRALDLLVERSSRHPKIEYIEEARIQDISSSDDKLKLMVTIQGSALLEEFDFLIFATGREPEDFLLRENFEVKNDDSATDRIYLIGDLKNGMHRQTAIAVGDGIKSAMKIAQSIRNK